MRVVKAERWHKVEALPQLTAGSGGERVCSACGSGQLGAPGETVLDGTMLARYRIVRCIRCGYDLLEPVTEAALLASR